MLQLSPAERRTLRARAHTIDPVVAIAENGLSAAVLKEIDTSLRAHELIKVRVYGDSRDDRLAYLERICAELGAAAVQHIGKLLVVYRPKADTPAAAVDTTNPPKTGRSTPPRPKRSFQR